MLSGRRGLYSRSFAGQRRICPLRMITLELTGGSVIKGDLVSRKASESMS
jgi:hypothetical protein